MRRFMDRHRADDLLDIAADGRVDELEAEGFRQILDDNRIRKTALYAVTDRRLIVLVGKDVRIAALDEVPSWAIRRDEDGYASALFGETAVNCIPGKWRELALCGTYKEEDTGVCKALVFYAVPDPDALERVLREVLPGKSA